MSEGGHPYTPQSAGLAWQVLLLGRLTMSDPDLLVPPGTAGLSMLRDAYACPCDESVMYDEPLYPTRASGMWVWVENDDEPYLDLVLGYISNNFGPVTPSSSRWRGTRARLCRRSTPFRRGPNSSSASNFLMR